MEENEAASALNNKVSLTILMDWLSSDLGMKIVSNTSSDKIPMGRCTISG